MNPNISFNDEGVKHFGKVVRKRLENVRGKEALPTRSSLYKILETIKRSDPGEIVIDEVLGMMLVMMTIPPDPKWIFLAFILFRIFDIFMPWPINQVDSKLKNALGVMLDDFIAALYAGIIILVIRFFL